MDNDRYESSLSKFCFLACARFLWIIWRLDSSNTRFTRLCTSSNGDNNVSWICIRIFCVCVCIVCVYIYIYREICELFRMNDRCLGYVLRVHAAWREKKKNAKNKSTRSVWWLQSCIEITPGSLSISNNFVLVDSACDVSSFFFRFLRTILFSILKKRGGIQIQLWR